jgi:cytochrome c
MKYFKICTILFLLGAIVSPGICAAATPGNNSANASISAASTGMPVADFIAFVDNAVAYAKANGKDKAIKEFNDNKSTKFIKGELYIFAYDFNGVTLAHPYQPEYVGNSQMGLKDANGVLLIKNMVTIARRGNGTVYYVWANPAHDKKLETKLTYVKEVDDTWWLGAGTYLPNILVNFSQASRNDLVSLSILVLNMSKRMEKTKP